MRDLHRTTTTRADSGASSNPPRAVALLMTVLLLTLLTATLTQVVFVSGTTAVVTARRNADLQHHLAVDSAIALAHLELTRTGTWTYELDRTPRLQRTFDIGAARVRVTVRDDGAKLDAAAFANPRRPRVLETKLRRLQGLLRLPRQRIRLKPRRMETPSTDRAYVWFDQLFAPPQPHAVFHVSDTHSVSATHSVGATHNNRLRWSDALTLFGDGRLDLRRAAPDMIEAVLGDLVPGLGRQLPPPGARRANSATDLLRDTLADIDEQTRTQLLQRVTWDAGRYALAVRTSIRSGDDDNELDVRRWYIVATLGRQTPVVHYRGQIEW